MARPPDIAPFVAARADATDPVGLAWLVTARWTTVAAAVAAALVDTIDVPLPVATVVTVCAVVVCSNLYLWWRTNRGLATGASLTGALVCADVILLTWLLLESGGALNPVSVFYLVQIVLAALVLNRTWAWIVAALSVAGYATLFFVPGDQLSAAQAMHPEIALHMRGMWVAFALTAVIIAVLVTRLAIAVERRDRALDILREKNARALRVAGLTTVVAGAAHELNTPLATIAVAAHELERAMAQRADAGELEADARLIRAEIDRCRHIVERMAGRTGEPMGESPRVTTLGGIATAALERLSDDERARVVVRVANDGRIVWPIGPLAQVISDLLRNALQASDGRGVDLEGIIGDGHARVLVIDRGKGMSARELARVGEPFYTTKPGGAGTGLGLFVARSTIEQLGGTLAIVSVEHEGTTVTIVMPSDVVRAVEGTS